MVATLPAIICWSLFNRLVVAQRLLRRLFRSVVRLVFLAVHSRSVRLPVVRPDHRDEMEQAGDLCDDDQTLPRVIGIDAIRFEQTYFVILRRTEGGQCGKPLR